MTFDGIGISFGIGLGFGWDDPPPPATTPQSSPKSGTSSYSSSPSKWDPAVMPPFVKFNPLTSPQRVAGAKEITSVATPPPAPPQDSAAKKN